MAILSFAHLKRKSVAAVHGENVAEPAGITTPTPPSRTTYRIPAVMPTALIHRANYCASGNAPCPRYLPATKHDREALGIVYGQCLREVKNVRVENDLEIIDFTEVWKNIPASATVSRCYYHQNWRE